MKIGRIKQIKNEQNLLKQIENKQKLIKQIKNKKLIKLKMNKS